MSWDRMGLGQGGLPAEPVHLSQSGTTRPYNLWFCLPPRGGRQTKKTKKKLARAGWPRRLALVRATSRAEVDVIGVQRC